ncbi:MAG TPA: hypothetical protein VGT41_06870 [Candidatus Babeliales bacterium]|nr:hypothetical protein [Candidatus Babeliales bacterium]
MNTIKKLFLALFALAGLVQVGSAEALFGYHRRYDRRYYRPSYYYDDYDDYDYYGYPYRYGYYGRPYYSRGEAIADTVGGVVGSIGDAIADRHYRRHHYWR